VYFAIAFPGLQYAIDVEMLSVRFRHFLDFGFVESTFYKFAGQISQFVRHRRRGQTRDDLKNLVRPVTDISLAKRSSLNGDVDPVTDVVLPPVRFRF